MPFDFYELYKDYPTTELLKIIKRPADYQPEAIAAVNDILSKRNVTQDELRVVEDHFRKIDSVAQVRKEKIDAIKNKATDFLEPVLNPTEKTDPVKWLNILLLVIAIQYAWTVLGIIKRIIRFFRCAYCRTDFFFYIDFLSLLYIPVVFFLLFKRKRWGWIILFADNLFALLLRLSESYFFFKYQDIHHGDSTSFLFPIFVRTAFAFFLWRESIAGHFAVNAETKKKTALVATGIALFFILITFAGID